MAGVMLMAMAVTDGLSAQSQAWKAPRRSARTKNPVRPDKAAIAAGKALFLRNCMACHGTAGKGDGPAAVALKPKPKDLTTHEITSQSDGELYWKIKTGRSPMPAFGNVMTRKQMWRVVIYIRSLKGSDAPAVAVPVKDPVQSVTTLLSEYFSLQEQLRKSEWNLKARTNAGKLVRLTSSLGNLATGDKKQKSIWVAQKKEVIRGANLLLSAKTSDPVPAFAIITVALDSLVEAFGHAESDTVFFYTCKMGKKKAGSVWIQKGKKVRNPFPWGKQMPDCGVELKNYAPKKKVKTSR